jgi:hypothetical protein
VGDVLASAVDELDFDLVLGTGIYRHGHIVPAEEAVSVGGPLRINGTDQNFPPGDDALELAEQTEA